MVKIKKIYDFINKIAPFDTAMDFDNCGLLVGDLESSAEKVLLSLDITNEVCLEAKNMGANLIISHHPVIFKPIKNIDFENPVSKLIKYEINAICAHTNLDVAKEGVNFHLAKLLNLSDTFALTFENSNPLGLIGYLEKELGCTDFAKFVKSKLGCEGLRYTEINKKIKKVAVCSGSGGSLIDDAAKNKVDAFVIGEIKHSDILKANEKGICIVDAGHFKTENLILPPLKLELEKAFPDAIFEISKTFEDKIRYL